MSKKKKNKSKNIGFTVLNLKCVQNLHFTPICLAQNGFPWWKAVLFQGGRAVTELEL